MLHCSLPLLWWAVTLTPYLWRQVHLFPDRFLFRSIKTSRLGTAATCTKIHCCIVTYDLGHLCKIVFLLRGTTRFANRIPSTTHAFHQFSFANLVDRVLRIGGSRAGNRPCPPPPRKPRKEHHVFWPPKAPKKFFSKVNLGPSKK